ncbi:protein FAM161B isoform X3 [Hemicordylus capensis]|nr:protein FAM161B isoform X3 [Hemicordylus capensis]XP_053119825.1 protein FAM161B isoform X3 [Hemicordylus capensis]XP_053119834.1 protein FAM161B isoform X3 [Hemicordylus capensis]
MYQIKLENKQKPPKEDEELEDFFQDNGRLTLPAKFYEALRSGNIKEFNSLTDLTGNNSKDEQNHCSFPQSCSRLKSTSAAWISSITIPQPFRMTLREAHKKSQLLKSNVLLEAETTTYKRQSQEEAECQKQFRAQPVPAHVYLPLYQEIMEKNEIRRQVETQKRRELLLSMQKPFSFQEKEEKRKETIRQKILEMLAPVEKSVSKVRKKIPKSIYEPVFGDKLKEAELFRKIRIQMRAKDLLESSCAPIELGKRQREKESRIASRNREEKLSFLQDNFSFKPRINTSVPDFEGLYWAFQREALCKREIKEATHSKPFRLRTSNLRCKHQVPNKMMDFQQPSKTPIQRSRSLTCLSSLSSNTLPVHITDAARKRESAIKRLQEDKTYRENEGLRWAELQRKKSQAMLWSVNCRAKAMDPHTSLKETHKEKLKQHWQNDRKRTKEYKKELEEMKMRVKNRPYLFEQVTKHGARQEAQRLFRDTLQQFGLNEEFVRNKGREAIDLAEKEHSESQRVCKSLRDTDSGTIQQPSQEGQIINLGT